MVTAPYNFIDLPSEILPSPMSEWQQLLMGEDKEAAMAAYKNFLQDAECNLTGIIELSIENLTPLFIGGNGEKFYAVMDDVPVLPGSSIRGMLHNLVKIVTCGAVRADEDIHGRHLYYRALMKLNKYPWSEDLNKHYKEQLQGTVKKDGVQPGFLVKDKYGDYRIYAYEGSPEKILINQYEQEYNTRVDVKKSSVEWHGTEVFCTTSKLGMPKGTRIFTDAEYDRIKNQILDKFDGNNKKALPYIARELGKQYIVYLDLKNMDWQSSYPVSEEVIQGYRKDIKRGGVNLLECGRSVRELAGHGIDFPAGADTVVPCFFVAGKDGVKFFGHGRSFRVPYMNSIADAVPKALRDEKVIDFAEAIFGKKEYFAGRVFFDDGVLDGRADFEETDKARILLEPNPTSYQLYLEQDKHGWKHWDSKGAKIRGYKMYWHQKTDWRNNGRAMDNLKVLSDLTPLKKGSRFSSKIRFRNLNKVELGALLAVLDIAYTAGEGIAKKADIVYKLGHGKSIGLGSVRIASKLFLEAEDAYTRLFDKDGWYDGYTEGDIHAYIDAFKGYLSGQNNVLQLSWENVMSVLCSMMDWHQVNDPAWSSKVDYMELKEFLNREQLPKAKQVYSVK